MNDKLKESVSAMMDNEADELELRRILAQNHDEDVVAVWRRYCQLRASINKEEAPWAGINLCKEINAALDEVSGPAEQPQFDLPSVKRAQAGKQNRRWWGGAAIAASVAFAVVFSLQFDGSPQQYDPVVATNVMGAANVMGATNAQGGASTVSVTNTKGSQDTSELTLTVAALPEFSAEHEARLNDYLMWHAGHAALNSGNSAVPFARLTSLEPEQN